MIERVSLEERLKWRSRPPRNPIMHQTWTDLLFLHWEAPTGIIQSSLPAGLQVDTWEGRAFVGIIPFFMRNVRPQGVPPLPWISYFLEMNVRTYVHDASGAPGVWFYSLDCNQPIAVWLARAFMGLPYRHARIQALRTKAGVARYTSNRRQGEATAQFAYRLEEPGTLATPGSLEFFLIERYLLFTEHKGRLFRAQVHHQPYPLHGVTVDASHATGLVPEGARCDGTSAHQIASRGVNVEIFGAVPAII
jgi:uncharacterized protein